MFGAGDTLELGEVYGQDVAVELCRRDVIHFSRLNREPRVWRADFGRFFSYRSRNPRTVEIGQGVEAFAQSV